MAYKPMNDQEHASFLTGLATRIRDAGSDHLKLSGIADDLDAQAIALVEPIDDTPPPKMEDVTGITSYMRGIATAPPTKKKAKK